MTLSLKQVIQALDKDEPDYDEAARLGAEALPHLATLISGADAGLASKAAALAARINDPGNVALLQVAAASDDARVRAAAAGAAIYLSDADASKVLLSLVGDRDVGVQKVALKAVPAAPSADLTAALQKENAAIGDPALRQLSDGVIRRIAVAAGKTGRVAGAGPAPAGVMPKGDMAGGSKAEMPAGRMTK